MTQTTEDRLEVTEAAEPQDVTPTELQPIDPPDDDPSVDDDDEGDEDEDEAENHKAADSEEWRTDASPADSKIIAQVNEDSGGQLIHWGGGPSRLTGIRLFVEHEDHEGYYEDDQKLYEQFAKDHTLRFDETAGHIREQIVSGLRNIMARYSRIIDRIEGKLCDVDIVSPMTPWQPTGIDSVPPIRKCLHSNATDVSRESAETLRDAFNRNQQGDHPRQWAVVVKAQESSTQLSPQTASESPDVEQAAVESDDTEEDEETATAKAGANDGEPQWTEGDVLKLYQERVQQIAALWSAQDRHFSLYTQVIDGHRPAVVCVHPEFPQIRSRSPEDDLFEHFTKLVGQIDVYLRMFKAAKAEQPRQWEPLPEVNVPTVAEKMRDEPSGYDSCVRDIRLNADRIRQLGADPEKIEQTYHEVTKIFDDCCCDEHVDVQPSVNPDWEPESTIDVVNQVRFSVYVGDGSIDARHDDVPGAIIKQLRNDAAVLGRIADEVARRHGGEESVEAVVFQVTAIHIYERGKYLRTVGDISADQAVGYKMSHEARHPERKLVIDTREISAVTPCNPDANDTAGDNEQPATVPSKEAVATNALLVSAVHFYEDGIYSHSHGEVMTPSAACRFVETYNEANGKFVAVAIEVDLSAGVPREQEPAPIT